KSPLLATVANSSSFTSPISRVITQEGNSRPVFISYTSDTCIIDSRATNHTTSNSSFLIL
nr:hypothetical protein [Candidatus Liberibacter asiaticus]